MEIQLDLLRDEITKLNESKVTAFSHAFYVFGRSFFTAIIDILDFYFFSAKVSLWLDIFILEMLVLSWRVTLRVT